jgi:hypothetical protein
MENVFHKLGSFEQPKVASIDEFHCISMEGPRKTMKTDGVALITVEIQLQI